MINKENIIVYPNYLCYETLPYAADIFYHERFTYLMPTGFTPDEYKSIYDFPQYCANSEILLPEILGEMYKNYFECTKQAVECCKILEPLGENIKKCLTSYSRDINAITKSRQELLNYPNLMQSFLISGIDLNLLSRELLSHIFLEVYIQGGYELVVDYIEDNFSSSQKIIDLSAAVILNRMQSILQIKYDKCITFNEKWHPFLNASLTHFGGNGNPHENPELDYMVYRLFFEVIYPLFGRCNSVEKTKHISNVFEQQKEAIHNLKSVCEQIVETCMISRNDKLDLCNKKMKEMVLDKVVEPLGYLISKPQNDVKKVVVDILESSGFIGLTLSTFLDVDLKTIGLVTASETISSTLKYISEEKKREKNISAKLLLKELKKNKLSFSEYQKVLLNLQYDKIDYPKY